MFNEYGEWCGHRFFLNGSGCLRCSGETSKVLHCARHRYCRWDLLSRSMFKRYCQYFDDEHKIVHCVRNVWRRVYKRNYIGTIGGFFLFIFGVNWKLKPTIMQLFALNCTTVLVAFHMNTVRNTQWRNNICAISIEAIDKRRCHW